MFSFPWVKPGFLILCGTKVEQRFFCWFSGSKTQANLGDVSHLVPIQLSWFAFMLQQTGFKAIMISVVTDGCTKKEERYGILPNFPLSLVPFEGNKLPKDNILPPPLFRNLPFAYYMLREDMYDFYISIRHPMTKSTCEFLDWLFLQWEI